MMQADPQSLLKLIEQHLAWYPLMEPRDVYKLLYQGVMGSEHLLISQHDFARSLRSEFERIQPDPVQRLLEPVRPDETVFRMNLRSYKSRGLGPDVLIPALLESAHGIPGSRDELRAVWMLFVQLCSQGQVSNFALRLLHKFSAWLEQGDYPAVHHSETYRREYQPSYRLISARSIAELGLSHAG